jgi:hypothetical protein
MQNGSLCLFLCKSKTARIRGRFFLFSAEQVGTQPLGALKGLLVPPNINGFGVAAR